MAALFVARIFDYIFYIISDEKAHVYIGTKELFTALGKYCVPKNLPVVYKEFKSFQIKSNRLKWNAKFLTYEGVRLVIERATCCKSKKIIINRGLQWFIDKHIHLKNPAQCKESKDKYLKAIHDFPTSWSDANIVCRSIEKSASDSSVPGPSTDNGDTLFSSVPGPSKMIQDSLIPDNSKSMDNSLLVCFPSADNNDLTTSSNPGPSTDSNDPSTSNSRPSTEKPPSPSMVICSSEPSNSTLGSLKADNHLETIDQLQTMIGILKKKLSKNIYVNPVV